MPKSLTKVGGLAAEKNAAGQPVLLVRGNSRRLSNTFSRPADANPYAAGDLIANSTTAAAVVPGLIDLGMSEALIAAAVLRTNNPSASGTIRVHLYSVAPVATAADNAPFAATGSANWLGSIDVAFGRQHGDGTVGRAAPDAPIWVQLPTTKIYYLLEAVTALTPANAAQISVALEFSPA